MQRRQQTGYALENYFYRAGVYRRLDWNQFLLGFNDCGFFIPHGGSQYVHAVYVGARYFNDDDDDAPQHLGVVVF